MSTWDDFEVAGDTDGSATLECKRCDRNAQPVLLIPAWHQSTLQQLQDAATEHLRDVHRGDPITVEYVGATPYQEPPDDGSQWQYRGGDGNPTMRRLIDATGAELEPWQPVTAHPTPRPRSCGWEWHDGTRGDSAPLAHRCEQPAASIHERHRCGCGITTPAAMAPGDPVVAVLNRPGYPDRTERERLAKLRRDQRALEERKRADPYQRSADAP